MCLSSTVSRALYWGAVRAAQHWRHQRVGTMRSPVESANRPAGGGREEGDSTWLEVTGNYPGGFILHASVL